ncbi:YqjF family protein [Desertivirga arenae]|uniref:YqjF family protein n=1 Tax=Desertivirga arenae TaxID=2810309 RepID=UPI001A96FCFE|nr:DUF2071 domain-containing protein [Pedobacter sp. SYSU D00823]
MSFITDTLTSIAHRPWALPKGRWSYYQEWNNALFLHYVVPVEILRSLVPGMLELDTYQGQAWVSVVAFKMENIRPRRFPALSFLSNFWEINVRTYVIKGNKRGVYFLNIEAEKLLSAFISRNLSGLPYEKSNISVSTSSSSNLFIASNIAKDFKLKADFEVQEKIIAKSNLDNWLTERYCLYLPRENKLFRYEIHHEEWEIAKVLLKRLDINYKIEKLEISSTPDLVHYSKGVRVLAWQRSEC